MWTRKLNSALIALFPALLLSACSGEPVGGTNAYTPAEGGVEREAILAPLRAEVKRQHHLDVVLKVTWMKVSDGWSWTSAMPESKDGTQHYEDVSALLRESDGTWKVLEMPCTEPENPVCLGDPNYFGGLKKRFPGMPGSILPQ